MCMMMKKGMMPGMGMPKMMAEMGMQNMEKRKMMFKEMMPKMMRTMMGEILRDMETNERIDFVSQIMSVWIDKLFETLEKEDRVTVVTAMLEKLEKDLQDCCNRPDEEVGQGCTI